MKLRSTLIASVAALGLSSAAAFAVPINGSYSLTVGNVTADTVNLNMASVIYFSGNTQSLTAANTLTSFTPTAGFAPSSVTACLACGTINNITGIPAGSATTPFTGPSPYLFSVNGLTFSLTALTGVIRTTTAQGSSLELKGTGTYTSSVAGYDPTAGSIDITIQNGSMTMMADSGSASGTAAGTVVPEPASIALLGAGLAAVGFVRRRKAQTI